MGRYFRTSNAADAFQQIDGYFTWRLNSVLIRRNGRNLPAGQAAHGHPTGHGLGRVRLLGTICYVGTT